MNSFKMIFLSYFRGKGSVILGLFSGFFLLYTGIAIPMFSSISLEQYMAGPVFFIYAAAFLIFSNASIQLKNLMSDERFETVPGYRTKNVIAFYCMFAIPLMVPSTILYFFREQNESVMHMNMIVMSLLFFLVAGIFLFGNGIFTYLTALFATSKLQDLSLAGTIDPDLTRRILLYSALAFIAYFIADRPMAKIRTSGSITRPDRYNFLTKPFYRLFTRLSLNKPTLSKLMRLSMFSPGYTWVSLSPLTILLAVSVAARYLLDTLILVKLTPAMFILIYLSYIFVFTTDFLQHRKQIPLLWLRSRTDNREAFTSSLTGAFYKTAFVRFLMITLIIWSGSDLSVVRMTYAASSGAILFVLLPSIAFLMIDGFRSASCKEWLFLIIPVYLTIAGVMDFGEGWKLFDNSILITIVYSVLTTISAMLFTASKKKLNTMDLSV